MSRNIRSKILAASRAAASLERLIEDQDFWIVHEGSDQQHALLHAFGIRRRGGMAKGKNQEKIEQGVGPLA